jgi:hypothetical protein
MFRLAPFARCCRGQVRGRAARAAPRRRERRARGMSSGSAQYAAATAVPRCRRRRGRMGPEAGRARSTGSTEGSQCNLPASPTRMDVLGCCTPGPGPPATGGQGLPPHRGHPPLRLGAVVRGWAGARALRIDCARGRAPARGVDLPRCRPPPSDAQWRARSRLPVDAQRLGSTAAWLIAPLTPVGGSASCRVGSSGLPTRARVAGSPRQARLSGLSPQGVGGTFWLSRNTFVGSYSRLSATRRAYVCGP